MATYFTPTGTEITIYGPDGTFTTATVFGADLEFSDSAPLDNEFDTVEPLTYTVGGVALGGTATYLGTVNVSGIDYPVLNLDNANSYVLGVQLDSAEYPTIASMSLDTTNFEVCFAAGSLIATPEGETAVEDLAIGDLIVAADGRTIPVKWIGRLTVHKLFSGPKSSPVRICAGALGDGLPHSDLTVTGDHGMILGGLVINASALLNDTTIHRVQSAELADQFTVYHVETEEHDVILVNGAATETFVDCAGRRAFDNYAEYVALYGADRIIPEMDRPRISTSRMVPAPLRQAIATHALAPDEVTAAA